MPPKLDAHVSGTTTCITAADVALHNNKDDCWLVIDGNVYDATRFLREHPGGEVLATWAGADATDVFSAFHPPEAGDMLSSLFVGPLVGGKTATAVSEFRALKARLEREGYFRPSLAYYAFKVASNMAILALAIAAIVGLRGFGGAVLGGAIIALFWQQCGWLSHDFLHHQVFANRTYGTWAGLFLGNVLQGFSVSWWRDKHNTHHAVPNVMEGVRDGDPDINTLPFLAWADAFLDGDAPLEGLPAALIRYQHVLFFPLLCVARTSWVLQSIIFVAVKPINRQLRSLETVTLALHYAYLAAITLPFLTLTQTLVFFFVSQAVGGVLLGTIFTINHNSMAVLPNDAVKTSDFAAIQLLTTRNITSSLFMDWLTGGLNYQIEHHLFPSLPRHQFAKVAPLVKAVCERHGLPYVTVGFLDGIVDVVSHLRAVAAHV